ncbi:cyclase family protein [Ascidiimonas sp. W6]|uniref:cyclase family protein n=1 Tax=Ascidiimonas meishanensis TaxID=3128903 RepID=UPI0030EF152D
MKGTLQIKNNSYQVDFSKPLDISLPLRSGEKNVGAWYLDPPSIVPVEDGNFIGSVAAGSPVNFNTINFNPHAHGTHTESVGHITKEVYPVNQVLTRFFFLAEVITIAPEKLKNDYVIGKKQVEKALLSKAPEALIIRTLPNTIEKHSRKYSNTNPPYLLEETAIFLREIGVVHLLIDLPSVDKEKDEGKLVAHKAFWNYYNTIRAHATITEFIYVANSIKDGEYLLNLQIAPFENDATPSKPILYKLL